jgi:hypothetical protein
MLNRPKGKLKQFLLVPFYGKKKQMPQNDEEGVICNFHIGLSLTQTLKTNQDGYPRIMTAFQSTDMIM